MTTRLALFDRDGVLNIDTGYTWRPCDCQLMPGVVDALNMAKEAGFKLVIVTNQSGIARGFYTEDAMHLFHQELTRQIAAAGGPAFDAIYFCPHHPDAVIDAYRLYCQCRKPAPGMVLEALQAFDASAAQSFLVGDKKRDIDAGEQAGVKGWMYQSGRLDEVVATAISALQSNQPSRL